MNNSSHILQESSSAAHTGETIISVRHLSKTYSVNKRAVPVHALNGVDLDIRAGEIVAMMGSSGSGKSTLMHMIGGLDVPSAGEVTVCGQSLHAMNEQQRSTYRNSTIGFIFQFFYLQPHLSVLKNIEVPLMFRATPHAEREQAAREAIRAVGLEERADHLPSQLSGGQMQRVAIARALVTRPKIILADEPTGNLDQATGAEIIAILKKVNAELGTTIVLVTHDPKVAQCASRTVTLSDGRIQ